MARCVSVMPLRTSYYRTKATCTQFTTMDLMNMRRELEIVISLSLVTSLIDGLWEPMRAEFDFYEFSL